MGCDTIKLGDGIVVIACSRGRRERKCRYCSRPASKLCDFKMTIDGGWKICDAPLCGQCAVSTGPETDECRVHKSDKALDRAIAEL